MGASGSNPNLVKDQPSISPFQHENLSATGSQHILLVEDSKADVFLMREALSAASVRAELHVVSDGESAIRFIDATDADDNARCPALILLDLNLPKKTGLEVLRYLRTSQKFSKAVVLIVTSSDSQNDRQAATQLGANGYFRKPSGFEAYLKVGEIVRDLLADPSA